MTDQTAMDGASRARLADAAGLSFLERLPLAQTRRWVAYVFAVGASLAALWLRFLVDADLPPGFPYLTFFPAVIVTAFLFGLGPGIVSAALCGLAAWYWFIPPEGFGIVYGTAVALGFYLLIVTVDIVLVHWMQRANAHLAAERRRADALAATREMLFNELQHRVGNNLQMVASLLSLQSRTMTDPEALTALTEASRRVGLVGRIQRTLYDSSGAQLVLDDYIQTLAQDTIDASGRDDIALHFTGATGEALIDPAAAIPLALVVAESISNAVEHAFADRPGRIDVSVAEEAGGYVLTVRDDGSGLPAGFDLSRSTSLGLRIATNLSRTLGGEFTLGPCASMGGTCATVKIAKP